MSPRTSPIISTRCGAEWKLLKAYAAEDAVDVIHEIDVEVAVVHASAEDGAVLCHCENAAAVLDQMGEVLAMVILWSQTASSRKDR